MIVATVFLLALVGTAVFMSWYYRDRSVTIGYWDTKALLPPGVSADDVRKALAQVETELVKAMPTSAVSAVLSKLYIVVRGVDSWTDSYGRKVGGQAIPGAIEVDKSLGSLLHECAHAVEWRVQGQPDREHAQWEARGIWDADKAYRTWLREKDVPPPTLPESLK